MIYLNWRVMVFYRTAGHSLSLRNVCISCITRNMEQPQTPIKVPAAEFQRNIGRYQDVALRQPVSVTRNGRERTVLISAEEYARLKRRDRQVMSLADFSAADLAALESARPPAEAIAFDHELKP